MNDTFEERLSGRFAGSGRFFWLAILGFASHHPRPGSPAEHLGWGGRLYADGRSADSEPIAFMLTSAPRTVDRVFQSRDRRATAPDPDPFVPNQNGGSRRRALSLAH